MIRIRTRRGGVFFALLAIALHSAGPLAALAKPGRDLLPIELCRSDGLADEVRIALAGGQPSGGGLVHPEHCAPCATGQAQPVVAPGGANAVACPDSSRAERPALELGTASSLACRPPGSRAPPRCA
jgi:hypothetical protein